MEIMCCRFYMEISPKLRPIIEEAQRSKLYTCHIAQNARPLTVEGEVFPGAMVPVLATGRSGRKSVFPMIWGFDVPGIKHRVANARCETAKEKKSFQESWALHRCIIPASWYYEWEHVLSPSGESRTGRRYTVQPRDEEMTCLCGLYRMENAFPHFVILTREAGGAVSSLHNRMPLILPEKEINRWIDPGADPHFVLNAALEKMICIEVGS